MCDTRAVHRRFVRSAQYFVAGKEGASSFCMPVHPAQHHCRGRAERLLAIPGHPPHHFFQQAMLAACSCCIPAAQPSTNSIHALPRPDTTGRPRLRHAPSPSPAPLPRAERHACGPTCPATRPRPLARESGAATAAACLPSFHLLPTSSHPGPGPPRPCLSWSLLSKAGTEQKCSGMAT